MGAELIDADGQTWRS